MTQAEVRAAGVPQWPPRHQPQTPNLGMGDVVRSRPLSQGQQFLTVTNQIATFLYRIVGNGQQSVVCTLAEDRQGTDSKRVTMSQADWNTLVGDSRPL